MLTSLSTYLRHIGREGSAINHVLSLLCSSYGPSFCTFADCGAAIGHTAISYRKIQTLHLDDEGKKKARIFCYEPLPENLEELRRRVSDDRSVIVRPYAVSNTSGLLSFCIPRRLVGESLHWHQGTSPVGFLGDAEGMETIKVEAIRLDSEDVESFDFIKLDLQGGEKAALEGLGDKLASAKLLYVEHQLMGSKSKSTLDYLLDSNFICFFDRLQIGIKDGTQEMPLSLLSKLGITVDKLFAPDQRGISNSYMLFGFFHGVSSNQNLAPGLWNKDLIEELRASGVDYLQTDIISLSPSAYNMIARSI